MCNKLYILATGFSNSTYITILYTLFHSSSLQMLAAGPRAWPRRDGPRTAMQSEMRLHSIVEQENLYNSVNEKNNLIKSVMSGALCSI